jgi:hypothetical protein
MVATTIILPSIDGSVGSARSSAGALSASSRNFSDAGPHISAGVAADIVAINLAGPGMHVSPDAALVS